MTNITTLSNCLFVYDQLCNNLKNAFSNTNSIFLKYKRFFCPIWSITPWKYLFVLWEPHIITRLLLIFYVLNLTGKETYVWNLTLTGLILMDQWIVLLHFLSIPRSSSMYTLYTPNNSFWNYWFFFIMCWIRFLYVHLLTIILSIYYKTHCLCQSIYCFVYNLILSQIFEVL